MALPLFPSPLAAAVSVAALIGSAGDRLGSGLISHRGAKNLNDGDNDVRTNLATRSMLSNILKSNSLLFFLFNNYIISFDASQKVGLETLSNMHVGPYL